MTATDDQPDIYEDRKTWEMRRELGIRDIAFRYGDEHPDTRPCPSWCWIATAGSDGFSHEVDQRHPLQATHISDDTVPDVGLSLYEANPATASDRWTQLSTLEPRLEQVGQGEPRIVVGRRTYQGRERVYEDRFLQLTLDDAQDLIAVLAYLVRKAEQ